MDVSLFDFHLPEDNIALRPSEPRDASRLLVVKPETSLQDSHFKNLADHLKEGDAIVLNKTSVLPARLSGLRYRGENTATMEITLLKQLSPSKWHVMARPAKRLKVDDRLAFGTHNNTCMAETLSATVTSRGEEGQAEIAFDLAGPDLEKAIMAQGQMPLPPYIAGKRKPDEKDKQDYQTIFAEEKGSVAAPTAGLHFTDAIFKTLREKNISIHYVTLHVGAGTFLPVKADNTDQHVMHSEWGRVAQETAIALNDIRKKGGRIIAVGTTSLRLLESATNENGIIEAFEGDTDIFIKPGYTFRAIDALLTNFHLPRSTLFMLVCALCGIDTMKAAYAHAIKNSYRFYSYGDASLLFKNKSSNKA